MGSVQRTKLLPAQHHPLQPVQGTPLQQTDISVHSLRTIRGRQLSQRHAKRPQHSEFSRCSKLPIPLIGQNLPETHHDAHKQQTQPPFTQPKHHIGIFCRSMPRHNSQQ
jgi:hypothetical protein